jgi:hypothetical protein
MDLSGIPVKQAMIGTRSRNRCINDSLNLEGNETEPARCEPQHEGINKSYIVQAMDAIGAEADQIKGEKVVQRRQ